MLIVQYLQANPASFIACVTVLGLIVGSFLNVVIHRLPIVMEREWRGQCVELLELPEEIPQSEERFNLIVPRSRCPECGHGITAVENIPIISYLVLRGRCSACGCKISWRYPTIELLSGVLSGVIAWYFGFGLPAAGALLVTWALIAISFIDFDHQLIPDSITLPFLWLGLAANLLGVFATLEASLIGAIAGYGSLWCVFHVFRLVTGKEGMGYGDFKLLAMLGAWLGWQSLPVIVLLSSFIGAGVGIALIAARGHDRTIPIPFGPYLAAAGWVTMLWGSDIIEWYLA